jgi:hypothetical protein
VSPIRAGIRPWSRERDEVAILRQPPFPARADAPFPSGPQPLAVNLTVQSWNVVAGTPKPVHVFPNRGT